MSTVLLWMAFFRFWGFYFDILSPDVHEICAPAKNLPFQCALLMFLIASEL